MEKRTKIAYLSPFPPRVCGVASFTKDLITASNEIQTGDDVIESKVVALNRNKRVKYGPEVVYSFDDNNPKDYLKAAEYLNKSNFDVVSLQHEYGLYYGDMGKEIVNLVKALKKPLVTTFHMISPINEATANQVEITKKLAKYSQYVVVMTAVARENLITFYKVDPKKIKIIPHGALDISHNNSNSAKTKLGFKKNTIVLTSINIVRQSRGIDLVIKALPGIIRIFPNLIYLVIGTDSKDEEEAYLYRKQITQLVTNLNLQDTVKFENRYVPEKKLIDFIKATDIFITPYRPPEQSSSGSLTYAFVAGKVCVSTPYNYAKELLSEGRGILVPWSDSSAIKNTVIKLLENPKLMENISKKAYKYGRSMVWPNVAKEYLELFRKIANEK